MGEQNRKTRERKGRMREGERAKWENGRAKQEDERMGEQNRKTRERKGRMREGERRQEDERANWENGRANREDGRVKSLYLYYLLQLSILSIAPSYSTITSSSSPFRPQPQVIPPLPPSALHFVHSPKLFHYYLLQLSILSIASSYSAKNTPMIWMADG
jgi:hypothetical protein